MWPWPNPPNIPEASLQALEEKGDGPLRLLLGSGSLGYGGGADVPLRSAHVERAHAEQWLHWKEQRAAVTNTIVVVASVIAAVAGILAAIFSFLALH
jgi:hypothetical protein